MTRLIYVDDEEYLLDLGKAYLEKSGQLEVDTFPSAGEAMKAMLRTEYDAVISDYQMPGINGIDFLKKLRSEGNRIPFILFTGRGREEIVIEALNSGANFYVQKGGDTIAQFADLEHRVKAAIGKKTLDDELAATNIELNSALDLAGLAPWSLDYRTMVLYGNDKIWDIFGTDARRENGYQMSAERFGRELVHPDDVKAYVDVLKQLADPESRKESDRLEFRAIRRDGEERNLLTIFGLIRNTKGQPIVLRGVMMDITESKRAEQALRESKARLQTLVQTIPDLVWLKDTNGVYLSCNSMFEKFYGAKEAYIVGKTDYEFVDRELADSFLKSDRDAMAAGKPTSNDEWITFANDGHRALLETIKTPMYDAKGDLIGVLGIGRDITQRKWAEDTLHEINARFDQLAEQSGTVTWEADVDGLFTYVSGVSENVWGYRPEELVGKMHFYDLVVEAERETIKSRVFEMAKHGERFAGIEHAVRTKDGRILWNSTSGIPLLNQDGTVRGHQGSDTDITQRRLANLALIESESFNRGLVDNLPEYIIIYGLDGRILYANTASARALGYDPKEAEGTQLLAYVAEESRDTITSMMKARGRGEEVPPYEINVVTRDGQRKSAMVKGSPIQYHDRSAFLVVLNDISDRKLMENTLRSREEKLSLITDHIRENVLLLDMGLKVQWVSPSTVRSRGFTFEELAEMPAEQQLPPESLEKLLLAAERLLTPENLDDPEKEVVFTDVLEFFKKDGDTVWAEVVISLIRDQSGRPSGLLAVGRDVTDHIRSKEALCSSGIGLWEWNVQTGETHFDEYWADIVGYDLAELSPFDIDTWMGMVHTDDLERSKDEIARHFAGEAPSFEVEVRLKCRDGHWTWVLVRGKVLRREADGLPIFTSGTLLDITERKQKEEAQRESEDKFRQLFELGSDALFLIDRGNGQLLELNRAAELMYGYSRTELLQMKSTDLSAQPEETERALKEATTVVPLRFHRKKDGTVFPVEITGTIHEHQGIPVLICAIREITERKRMEEALHESEKRYRLIADNMVEVVVMLDLDLHVIYASPSIEDVFHYTVEEAMYKDVSQIMTPESLQVVMRALEETMAIKTPHANGSRPSLLLELEEYRKDGSTIWVSNSLTFAYDEANEPVAIISVVRDITDRKNIENALNEANRKLNLLNNITRHEITNQVMALTGFLELCKLKEKDPQVLAYLEKMDHATESVKRQIAFTKEYQDIGVKAPAWASPGRQTAEAFALLHPAGMDFEDDSGGVEIFADPLAEKVPYNLIDNSMRHGEHVTRIKLSAEQRGDAVLLLYEDNGVGIVGKDGERLFEKGFGKNTGFGLFLTREILAITGITITETGTAGEGVRFEMLVPAGAWRLAPPRRAIAHQGKPPI